MDTLREHVLDMIEGADEVLYRIGDDQVEPGENAARGELVHLFIKCRESIEPNGPMQETFENFAQRNKKNVEEWLDNYYFYPQLWAIPEMVRRTLLLAKMDAMSVPSSQTNIYLSESTKCYIQGLSLPAVAMARAALEQSLKERFAQLRDLESEKLTLGSLIERAAQKNVILSPDLTGIARDLNRKCNQAMHNRPPRDEDAAREILVGIRSLIMNLFSDQ